VKPGAFLRSASTLGVGYAVVAALYWALLNVPESSVLALTLSAALVLLMVVTAGATTAVASAFSQHATAIRAVRRVAPALSGFVGGLALFAILWWLTAAADDWWRAHLGEIDAVLVRYPGVTRTGRLHEAVLWAIWLARWVLGLSAIAGLVTALADARGVQSGLRASVRLAPLTAVTLGVVAVSEGLWRLAYWRPGRLTSTWVEPVFVVTKLAVLYALTAFIAALVLHVHRRAASGGIATEPPSMPSPIRSD
jgi:hypothetical protein